jgi:hypothetical protein
VSRQTIVALGIGVVMGAVALVIMTRDSSGPAPEPGGEPARPASAAPEPTPVTTPPPAPAEPSRSVPRSSTPPSPVTSPEPAVPAVPVTATLHISSDVPEAQVFVDRKFIGTAPVTATDIAPGARTINVSAPGYEGISETFEIVAGPRDILMALKVIRLNESIPVQHKHGIGSCSGQLIATPAGLRYETDNKNDAFSVPLTELETFTMDFLAKNLKVKIRKGKTFDFTDPGGKPDPLYYFHQEVDKVRARLARGGGTVQTPEAK